QRRSQFMVTPRRNKAENVSVKLHVFALFGIKLHRIKILVQHAGDFRIIERILVHDLAIPAPIGVHIDEYLLLLRLRPFYSLLKGHPFDLSIRRYRWNDPDKEKQGEPSS